MCTKIVCGILIKREFEEEMHFLLIKRFSGKRSSVSEELWGYWLLLTVATESLCIWWHAGRISKRSCSANSSLHRMLNCYAAIDQSCWCCCNRVLSLSWASQSLDLAWAIPTSAPVPSGTRTHWAGTQKLTLPQRTESVSTAYKPWLKSGWVLTSTTATQGQAIFLKTLG